MPTILLITTFLIIYNCEYHTFTHVTCHNVKILLSSLDGTLGMGNSIESLGMKNWVYKGKSDLTLSVQQDILLCK